MDNEQPRVLLVEDDNVTRLIESKTLEELQCHFDTAKNGAEALLLLKENHYDIIFMDLHLPDLDGLTLTQKIRGLAGYKLIPIVALTAHDNNEYQNQATWVGMNGFITKPLTKEKCGKALLAHIYKGKGSSFKDAA